MEEASFWSVTHFCVDFYVCLWIFVLMEDTVTGHTFLTEAVRFTTCGEGFY